jgi:hypothetical protein
VFGFEKDFLLSAQGDPDIAVAIAAEYKSRRNEDMNAGQDLLDKFFTTGGFIGNLSPDK